MTPHWLYDRGRIKAAREMISSCRDTMKEWEIVGPSGFRTLQIGARREQVREQFGPHRVFERTPESPEADHFVASGLQVTYDDGGRVAFIEITAPADPV